MSAKVVVTGGGTGGHIFPALAIARELNRRGVEILYIGSSRAMEAKLVPPSGFRFVSVRSGAVKNQSLLKILRTLFDLALGFFSSWKILGKEKPHAVVGVGGYISVPVVVAAFVRRIPIFLQEQNASVGIANRFLGLFAREIFLGFEQAKKCFPLGKTLYTGNPLREEFYQKTLPAYDAKAAFLLVLGGSQGAKAINGAVLELLTDLYELFPDLEVLHQTGEQDCERVRHIYASQYPGKYTVVPFIEDILSAYGKASLVIARSGALTCSELIQVERPAIFVPFPRRGQNDQTANAYLLEQAGCARVVEQGDEFVNRLWSVLSDTFRPQALAKMQSGFATLRRPAGIATIGDHIHKVVGKAPRVPPN